MAKLIGNDLWIEINYGIRHTDANGGIWKEPQFQYTLQSSVPESTKTPIDIARIESMVDMLRKYLYVMNKDIVRHKKHGVERKIE